MYCRWCRQRVCRGRCGELGLGTIEIAGEPGIQLLGPGFKAGCEWSIRESPSNAASLGAVVEARCQGTKKNRRPGRVVVGRNGRFTAHERANTQTADLAGAVCQEHPTASLVRYASHVLKIWVFGAHWYW